MLAVCLFFLGTTVLPAEEFRTPKVAILVSQNIRPYIEAVEGMSVVLSEAVNAKVQMFRLEKFKGKSRTALIQRLVEEKFDLFVTVGPGATRFVWKGLEPKSTSWLYSMVLNPEKVLGPAEDVCGVPLEIPVQRQLEMITRGLPTIRRIGLLYDPDHNAELFRKATEEASSLNLKIIPLEVSSKKDIPNVLKHHWQEMDGLWLIPDRTVISESIVQYIIKEALFKKVPVIGYNRFFYESGAIMAFVFDYEELGRQTGRLALNMLRGKACEKEVPVFHVWLNLRVIERLGIDVPEKKTLPIEVGP